MIFSFTNFDASVSNWVDGWHQIGWGHYSKYFYLSLNSYYWKLWIIMMITLSSQANCQDANIFITDDIIVVLTHWGWVMHICVGNLTIIGSDYGLSPGRHQAIIWTNTGILLIGTLGTNFSEISIAILTFSSKKNRLKLSSAKWWPFFLGLSANDDKISIMTTVEFHCTNKLFQLFLSFYNQLKNPESIFIMTASWHGKVFHITGPLWGESTSHWWIPLTKGQ